MADNADDVFPETGDLPIGSIPSVRDWANNGIFTSISSEASDEVAEDSMTNEYLSARLDDETRQRRPSRAPVEVTGRDGVWSANEVARELRTLAEGLWDLAIHGEEKKLVEMVMLEGINSPVANTTLLVAAWHGLTGLTHKLLAEGASPNTCDPKGRTPLHLASCAGADDCVALLIKFGANVSSWDSCHKSTPLHCAAGAPSPASVKLLLDGGASPNAGIAGHGVNRSALHLAVQAGSPECVRLLLEAGAAPNTTQLFTETPLHLAAALGAADCMRLLLQSGADVRVQVGQERATSLHLAAEDGNADCARMLLDAGASPHAQNARGQTPAHLAALAQSAETLELLLQRGADPNSVDAGGRTPLHSAIVKGSRSCECVRLLVEHGADVNRADTFGYTPLHIAALSEFSPCVELLIRHGGHVTARTKGGVSALSFMVRRTPDALQRFVDRLDSSISLHEHELGDVDCTLKLDFRILVPRMCHGEAELLLSFVESGQRHLLQHPLCQTFLFLKWKHIRKFFLISLLFHALFVALHTSFVMSVYLETPVNNTRVQMGRAIVIPKLSELPVYVTILGYCLLSVNIMLVLKEIFQMAHAKCHYMRRWENWLQWLIIATVFACVEALWLERPRLTASWQHHIAALGIFFTWLELMMLVGRFPMFGLYIQMLTTVAANFVKFLLAYSCLLIAFALSFTLLFPQYPAFRTVPLGLLKTLVMMIGEFEYEDMFFNKEYPVIYEGTLHLLFFIFVVLTAVVLMNLLVGLAVSDIQGLQRSAGLDRLVRQAELVSHIESLLFSKLLKFIPDGILTFCHQNALLVASNYRWAFYIRPNDPREARIPKDLIEACYRLVATRSPRKRNKDTLVRNNRNVSQYSTASGHHSGLDTHLLEQIQNQLGVLMHKSEQSITAESSLSQRITNLASHIESLRQELVANSKIRQSSIPNSANGNVIPDLSSSI